ncbi:DEAD/DEAH box helicase [Colwellia sp. MB3u-55]|uniref:DEAD/DEAH box helicase n=1 Tax=Colwellia sp. MB3u-55 TaxID=2759810 RepID=UPI0015F44AB1|nr:DEAD/DEAH box helicase family protein [Colwellia sp. MB3u-55]MBA6252807.1 DEAD/DEAH box helicase family protein [Colwellia sp. MB3u-55]
MKLRKWQAECIDSALLKYNDVTRHFLALATPGAGKTTMASVLAKRLLELDEIDLVLCFSPSSIVARDFSDELSKQFDAPFDGSLGAMGNSITYQKLNTLNDSTWRLFDKYRIFVIFDEIHHCAGSCVQDANSWGEPIINKIKDKAKYSIALTGTPWRSDALPIALSQYCESTQQIQCDYIYGLKEAIRDKVCRIPQIIALDNDNITVVTGDETSHFNSFIDLLSQSIIPYSEIVTNDVVIEQLLINAQEKLDELRLINKGAGGLIVASSIAHAWQIHLIVQQVLGDTAVVVTSNEIDADEIIKKFRDGSDKWIISVGMISEGTNIPRLQVCCQLTNIKTELHFRQILGRILRMTGAFNQEAIMFIPADPKLVKYSYRVAQDIPDEVNVVQFTTMDSDFEMEIIEDEISSTADTEVQNLGLKQEITLDHNTNFFLATNDQYSDICPNHLTNTYEKIMKIFGRFKQESLCIDGFDSFEISAQSLSKLNNFSSELS